MRNAAPMLRLQSFDNADDKELQHLQKQYRVYRAILSTTPDFAYVFDLNHRFIYANEALLHMWGKSWGEAIGKNCLELGYEPWHAEKHDREIEQVIATRAPVRGEVPFNGAYGRRIYDYIFTPVFGPGGGVEAVAGTTRDITESRCIADRQQLLAEAGRILGSSLDYESTLAMVCKIMVAQFADWCALDLFTEDKQVRRIEVAHKDPARVQLAHEYRRRFPPQESDKGGLMEVLRTGQPQLYPEITDEMLVKGARNDEHLEMMRSVGLKSVIIVPLTAHGHTIGAMTLVSAESGYRYGESDLQLALELALRAAMAVENAKLFSEARELARRQEETLEQYRIMQQHLSMLVEASGSLSASLDLPSVLDAVLALSKRLVKADAYAIWRHDATSGKWTIGSSSNLSKAYQQDSVQIVSDAPAIKYQPFIAEDVFAMQELNHRKAMYHSEGIRSLMTIPLKVRGAPSGSLVFYYRTPHAFCEIEISIATALANLAGSAIGSAELYDELKLNDRRKDEFLAILAHELRNPLAPISNVLPLLHSPSADNQARIEVAGLINRQIDQITHLLDDLLDVSRITRGKIELRLKPMNVMEAITIAMEAAKPFINERRQTLKAELPAEAITVNGDITRLSQVFTNLLNNAAKYTDENGHIVIRASATGNEAQISIRDNGIGIPKHMLHSIFDMFAQVDSSLERSYGGLGIGLTLVKDIVEMHKGNVVALSEGEGKGSEFRVRLPLQEHACQTQSAASSVSGSAASDAALSVLVVDDNDASAKTMGWTLEILGHQARIARDGREALALAGALPPDVVLLDIGLPGMNGYEVCKALRKMPALKHTVFIAQTGWGQKEHIERSKEAGFDYHLVKPVKMEVLQPILARKQPLRD